MTTLALRSVSKHYGDTVAVDNIDLNVEDNEFFCIFGPPSSGKTTILQVLLGLVSPDRGRVEIDGRDVTRQRPQNRDLGMVFQNLALYPHMTARENLAFPLHQQKASSSFIDERISAVAAKLDITPLLDKLPSQLSGGERQRVAIGRALVRDPKAYLMDEPIAALDARLREAMRVELKRLQRDLKHTFVYVTHDQEEAMSIADRMAIMRDGQICQIGTPKEIYNRPATRFVAEIVGSPKINVIEGGHDGGVFNATDIGLELAFDSLSGTGAAAIAVRPEDVEIQHAGSSDGNLDATVYEVEPLGGHTIVDLKVKDTIFRAQISGGTDLKPDTPVRISIKPEKCHLFDGDTEKALVYAQ